MRPTIGLILLLLAANAFALAQTARPAGPKYLPAIKSQSEFDTLKRVYYRGRLAALPHLMFVIDREQDKVYYANSKLYRFHSDFVNANYLSLERGQRFFENNYLRPDRRFILGTIAFQPNLKQFTFEFQATDLIPAELIALTYQRLSQSFFAPLFFKPTSPRQEEVSTTLAQVPRLLPAEINGDRPFEVINEGEAIGILRLIEQNPPERELAREDIVIFKEVPVTLTPVAGVITTRLGSPLSHMNMLAKSWRIPDAYVKEADTRYRELVGRWVRLKVTETGYTLEPVDQATVQRHEARQTRMKLLTPRADLTWQKLTDLKAQRARDVARFGAKSANLGEVAHARLPNVIVPPGFTIPFHYYAAFARQVKLEDRVIELLNDDDFHHQAAVRKVKLKELRDYLQQAPVSDKLRQLVLAKVREEYQGKGLFVRSSTNAEDLPNFSGAGLYTTVPNVKGDEALIEAIKTVWASIWNFEAFEARELAGIDHLSVYVAVLLQEGVNADSAGVLITTNPFDRRDRRGVYINAKRGLGIKVVEGQRVPEQIIYRPQTNSIRVLTRSAEDSLLTFDDRGGVKEIQTYPNRAVLTDATTRRLARAALAIKRLFGGRDQDIEWLIYQERVYIVQARPYLG